MAEREGIRTLGWKIHRGQSVPWRVTMTGGGFSLRGGPIFRNTENLIRYVLILNGIDTDEPQ